MARLASRGRWETARHLELLNKKLLDLAARRITRLMIFMPPRHGKSTLASHYFPMWWLGNQPDKRLIMASYEAGYASTWGGAVRDSMAEWGPELWGVDIRSDKKASSDWVLRAADNELGEQFAHWPRSAFGGMRTAGIGTGVTGRGGNAIIIDDPVKDAKDAHSKVKRESAWQWYTSTLRSRLAPGGVIVLIMTRWHEDDLAGRLLKSASEGGEQWDVLSLPAEAEKENDELGREMGAALWPEVWTSEELAKIKKAQTDYWWGALYQQRPTKPGGRVLQRTFWRYYDKDPVEIAETADEVITAWDMTFKDTDTSDFVVGQVWARIGVRRYLLDQVRDRMTFTEAVEAMRAMAARWPMARWHSVENAANGPAVVDTLKDEVPGIYTWPRKGIKHPGKEERVNACLPRIRVGNVLLPSPRSHPWVVDLIDECASFPDGLHDDQVDGVTQGLLVLGEIEKYAPRFGRA